MTFCFASNSLWGLKIFQQIFFSSSFFFVFSLLTDFIIFIFLIFFFSLEEEDFVLFFLLGLYLLEDFFFMEFRCVSFSSCKRPLQNFLLIKMTKLFLHNRRNKKRYFTISFFFLLSHNNTRDIDARNTRNTARRRW